MKKIEPWCVQAFVALLVCLLLSSCANTLVKGYKGPELPRDKIAIIEPHTYITIVAYDGEKLGSPGPLAVAPGTHTIEVSTAGFDGVWMWEAGPSHLFFEFNAEEGQTYVVKYVNRLPNEWSMQVVDKRSGEKVKGRFVLAPAWALSNFETAIKRVPNDADAWIAKANALLGLKRYEEALQATNTVMGLRPDDPLLWNTRGLILLRMQRYEDALEAFEKTIELAPREAFVWFNKGLTLELMEKYVDAVRAYDKGLELNPNDAEAQKRKTEILRKLGGKREVARVADTGVMS
jgi:hypothetical protein